MYLTRRNPSNSLPTFQSLQRELNRLFDEASGDFDRSLNGRTWTPPVEIYETGDDLVISIPKREEAKPRQIEVKVG